MRLPILQHHVTFKAWVNEWPLWRTKFEITPPLNPYDPPANSWTLLLIALKVTAVIRYAPRPWPCPHPVESVYDDHGRLFCYQCSSALGSAKHMARWFRGEDSNLR